MFQVLIRIVAFILLAFAVVFAVLDITRSITASAVVLTSTADTLEALKPGLIASMATTVSTSLHPFVWDPLLTTILALPGFLLCFLAAMLLLFGAERRRRPLGRFSSR